MRVYYPSDGINIMFYMGLLKMIYLLTIYHSLIHSIQSLIQIRKMQLMNYQYI